MTCRNRTAVGIAFALAFGMSGSAAGQSNAAYDHVVKVQANKNKYLYVAVAGNFSSVHGCRTPWWAKSQNRFDDPQTKAMLQIALSSLLARAPVHVYTEGCDADGYPILAQLQIQEREPPAPPPPPAPPTQPPPKRCTTTQKCCGSVNPDGTCNGQCWPRNNPCP
jgi:hypothetical protein